MKTEENDFVECLAYSEQTAVVMTGNFSDTFESGKVSFSYLELTTFATSNMIRKCDDR